MADVQPVYPTYQRPQFDLAPTLAKANAITLQDQTIAQNKVMNPLEAAAAQQRLESETRANTIGGATQDDTIAADRAVLQDKVKTALNSMDYETADAAARKTQAIGAVTADVLAHPEHAAAAEKVMVDQGLMTQDAIAEWRAHLADPKTSSYYTDAAAAAQAAMVARGPPTSSYGKADAAAAAVTDRQFAVQANAETNKFAARNPDATPEQIDHFFKSQLARLKGQPAPPAPPTPVEQPGWWARNAPEFLGGSAPPAEAAGSVVEDKAQHEKDLTGETPQAAEQSTKGDRAPVRGGAAGRKESAPAPAGTPATYEGDANDETAVKAWFKALPVGSMFVPPGSPDGQPMKKEKDFQ